MQYTAIFHGCKYAHFQMNFLNIFLIFARNIDCGYTEAVPTSTHNLCFGAKNIRKIYIPVNPNFTIKSVCKGVFVTRTGFVQRAL